MKLLVKVAEGKGILVTTSSLETYDGTEIVLKDGVPGQLVTGYLELEIRQGALWKHLQTGNLAVCNVCPWFMDEAEEVA